MDAQLINDLFDSGNIARCYKVKVGDSVRIRLPDIPLTKYTQFLKVEKTIDGDVECFVEEPEPSQASQEGMLLPRHIVCQAICCGTIRIVLQAANRLTGEPIAGARPFEITIEVERT
jgi:hypothetical protein